MIVANDINRCELHFRQLMLISTHWQIQGAVLSPILFTDYIDKLLTRLRESGVGCHIDGVFASAFGYADDIVLLAPSLDALRHMIALHCIALHCIALHCIALHCIALHCIV